MLSLGTERVKDALYELLVQTLADMGEHISAIYERNDVKIRELEGMEEYKGFWDYYQPGKLKDYDLILSSGDLRGFAPTFPA